MPRARWAGATRVLIGENCVVTPSARDFLAQHNIALVANGKSAAAAATQVAPRHAAGSGEPAGNSGTAQKPARANPRLFSTPEAEAIKKEICAVGRKLWMRQFVDGNGGNISYRIGPNEVICTPTLVSKFDLTPEDLEPGRSGRKSDCGNQAAHQRDLPAS
jgi:L-fuculose-phosphate aldolase